MLETIREFALEQLQKDGELDLTQQRHADYFADWAGQAETHLYGPAQADWLARLDRETENLRAALSWLLQVGQFETGSRLAYAQAVFWRRRGRYREGRDWLEKVLVSAAWADLPDDLRAKTLQAAGNMAYRQGDWNAAQQWLGESLKLFRTAGDRGGLARVLFDLGWVAIGQADWAAAKRLNQESLLLAREAGDSLATYRALTNLGWTMLCTSDHKSAASLFSEALESASQVGHTKGVAVSLANLGWIALYQQDARRAAELATQSLCLCNELGEKEVMAECLELLAVAAVNLNEYESAARLSGAAQELWDDLHINRPLTDHYTAAYAAALAVLHQHLPDVRFSVYWKEGKAMTPEAVIALAQAG
jgi:tetratricopeptide (TPR) repeat protein